MAEYGSFFEPFCYHNVQYRTEFPIDKNKITIELSNAIIDFQSILKKAKGVILCTTNRHRVGRYKPTLCN